MSTLRRLHDTLANVAQGHKATVFEAVGGEFSTYCQSGWTESRAWLWGVEGTSGGHVSARRWGGPEMREQAVCDWLRKAQKHVEKGDQK